MSFIMNGGWSSCPPQLHALLASSTSAHVMAQVCRGLASYPQKSLQTKRASIASSRDHVCHGPSSQVASCLALSFMFLVLVKAYLVLLKLKGCNA